MREQVRPNGIAAPIACGVLAAWFGAACAQPLAHLADPAVAAPSRLEGESVRFDADVRAGLIAPSPTDARANYVAATLETTDLPAKVRHLAAARVAGPQEKLYLASLGLACLAPTRPALPECEAMDRLADWARRDEGNGLPALLLAEQARKHGEREKMVAFIEQGGRAASFDDYDGRAGLALWEYAFASPIAAEPAVRARWATGRSAAVALAADWPYALRNTCLALGDRPDGMREACRALGNAMWLRGSTLNLRLLGSAVIERNVVDPSAKEDAASRRASVNALAEQCDAARLRIDQGLESADTGERAAAADAERRWVEALAQFGQSGTCERVRDGLPPHG